MGGRRDWLARAGFLAAGLAVFFCCAAALARAPGAHSPSAAVAGRYLSYAARYDYLGVYSLFDPEVLEREMERYGLDRAGMEALAEKNRTLARQYVQEVTGQYGVDVSYRWRFLAEEELREEELEALARRCAADGIPLDLQGGRKVTFLVTPELTGRGGRTAGEVPLDLTVVRTASGWFLDRGSIWAFEEVMHTLPDLAWESSH